MSNNIKCPRCGQFFSDMKSYQDHICSSTTGYGDASDIQKGHQETAKEGTGRP